jgi:hypothetical protein
MKNIYILISILIFLFFGCNINSDDTPQKDEIVIRAYLYANEPVTDIQITGTIAIGVDTATATPINNASVYLIKDGKKYNLIPSAGDSGYYHYAGSDLKIQTGDIFRIYAEYNGQTAYGETEVPPAPENLTISSDTLYVTSFSTGTPGGTPPTRMDSVRIKAQWDSVANASYFIVIENMETDPEAISTGGFGGGNRGPSRFLSQPMSQSHYSISQMSLSYYGKHKIKIYRINQEYADLYRSRQQDSRDLNEPLTNIVDGLGIFSAFSCVEGYFYVEKKE